MSGLLAVTSFFNIVENNAFYVHLFGHLSTYTVSTHAVLKSRTKVRKINVNDLVEQSVLQPMETGPLSGCFTQWILKFGIIYNCEEKKKGACLTSTSSDKELWVA